MTEEEANQILDKFQKFTKETLPKESTVLVVVVDEDDKIHTTTNWCSVCIAQRIIEAYMTGQIRHADEVEVVH